MYPQSYRRHHKDGVVMSDTRKVRFTTSQPPAPLRGIIKHTESYPRDSGVGSSSSDNASSSGSLDELLAARNHIMQSNNVDALRGAFSDLLQDHEQLKKRSEKKEEECAQQRKLRREEQDRTIEAEGRIKELTVKLKRTEEALSDADNKIVQIELQLDNWKTKYDSLYELWKDSKQAADAAMILGGSGESSLELERTRSRREKKDSTDLTTRMRERINREPNSEGSNASRSSHNSEGTTTTKRSSRRLSTSGSTRKPYVEKMPTDKRHAPNSSSHSGQREYGDYVAHPLPRRPH